MRQRETMAKIERGAKRQECGMRQRKTTVREGLRNQESLAVGKTQAVEELRETTDGDWQSVRL